MYTNVILQNQASFILKANVKKVIHVFLHIGYGEKDPSLCENIGIISGRPAWRILTVKSTVAELGVE